MSGSWMLESVERDGVALAAVVVDAPVRSCPGWTGGDLLAHVCGYAMFLPELFAGDVALSGPVPAPGPERAVAEWPARLDALLELLTTTPAATPVPNWSVQPDTAEFWIRRTVHEFAVHRWDGDTTRTAEPEPIPAGVAADGIAEYFEAFAATGIAAGRVPRAVVTMVLELTDTGDRLTWPLPNPGPETVVRGPASDLLLALWHRRSLLDHHVSGERTVLEQWPRI
jgi:uncharacterized protein (TIGR03083 family)